MRERGPGLTASPSCPRRSRRSWAAAKKRGALSPPAISALGTIAAVAMTAEAKDTMSAGRCEALMVTLAATGGAGRRAALFDNQPWNHVAKAASAILFRRVAGAVRPRRFVATARCSSRPSRAGKAVAPAPAIQLWLRKIASVSCTGGACATRS